MEKTLFTLRPPTYYIAIMSFIPLTMFLAALVAFKDRNTIPNGSIISLIALLLGLFFVFALGRSFKVITLTDKRLIVSGFLHSGNKAFALKDVKRCILKRALAYFPYTTVLLEIHTKERINSKIRENKEDKVHYVDVRMNYGYKEFLNFTKHLKKQLGKRFAG